MPKSRQRNLKIKMKFRAGRWEMVNGGQVPVKDGTEAELRVPVSSISDEGFLERMTEKGILPIRPKGVPLRVLVSIKDRKDISTENLAHLRKFNDATTEFSFLAETRRYGGDVCFLTVEIGEPNDRQLEIDEVSQGGLWLIFEGAQPVEIKSSKIILPDGVSDQDAISLNHAFTLISEVYEPWRKAHTGSIYDRYFYQEDNGMWYPLALLRDASIAQQEQKIAFDLWKRFLALSKPKPTA
jgi:hypothetical protein